MSDEKTYNSEATREELLHAAFKEIYVYGFQAASLKRILQNVNLTKGALYHHYKSKKELGLAVINNIISERMYGVFMEPLENSNDPVSTLRQILSKKAKTLSIEEIKFGCPLNNLTQEMSPIDKDFNSSLKKISNRWVSVIKDSLERGEKNGKINLNTNSYAAALFIVASIEGAFSLGKNAKTSDFFEMCMQQLIRYIKTLAN